ncbi:MAG: GNAT family N-acetyltransferase [Nocardioides sp.]|uniref:GNAT family N-acetyltransferase n=1 Tax=Nocardioides sp. TaxID=35761 RepID=UPI003F08B645
MPEIAFRPAGPADIPAVVALVTSAYRGDDSRAGWTTEADILDGERIDAEQVAEDLSAPRSTVVVAEREGQLVACVHVADRDGVGYLGMFAVAPGEQGTGLGSRLMGHAEAHVAREWGPAAIEMTVIDVREELIAFYERRGYVRTGETKPFPYGDERFGIPRRDDLRFVVLRKPLT